MKMLVASCSCKVGRVSAREGADLPLPTWKRALDISCCLLALPFLLLCTLLVAVFMKVASPGPTFFRQERVGCGQRRFKLYKFRTMHVAADTAEHQRHFEQLAKTNVPMHKLDGHGDRRLIPGGKLMRALALDELPQILNILRGEMSIVGPRPCIPYELAQYSLVQKERFEAMPGLTGLWQVSGKNRTTFEEMVKLDIEYARTRSLALDLKIIFRTVPALCTQVVEVRKRRPQPVFVTAAPLTDAKP